jgi:hypothetical protein
MVEGELQVGPGGFRPSFVLGIAGLQDQQGGLPFRRSTRGEESGHHQGDHHDRSQCINQHPLVTPGPSDDLESPADELVLFELLAGDMLLRAQHHGSGA